MKKCPFCKNEIEIIEEQCPNCKMVLIEKIPTKKTSFNNSYTPPKDQTTKENTYTYTPSKKSSTSKIRFGIPNTAKGWIISIVGSILLTVVLSYHGASNPLPDPIPTTNIGNINPLSPPVLNTTSITKTPPRFLPNSTILFSNQLSFNGLGVLNISNGSGSDAIVKLITNDGRKVYSVYIRNNNSSSIKNINDGVYRLLFSFGSDWDSSQKKFLINPSAQAFDDNFDFKTTHSRNGSEYDNISITLNSVASGNATAQPIDMSVFDNY
jgi:hypothetical protein